MHARRTEIGAQIAAIPGGWSLSHGLDRDTQQCRSMITAIVVGAIVDWVAIVSFVTNVLCVYRAADMLRAVRRAPNWDAQRLAIVNTTVEYWLDLLALGEALVLTLSVWSALSLWNDVFEYASGSGPVSKPSLNGLRRLVTRHMIEVCCRVKNTCARH